MEYLEAVTTACNRLPLDDMDRVDSELRLCYRDISLFTSDCPTKVSLSCFYTIYQWHSYDDSLSSLLTNITYFSFGYFFGAGKSFHGEAFTNT
jgi:hypothetical protein